MPPADLSAPLEAVKRSLLKYGILLHSDLRFPNLVGIVAGEIVHGSWWSHPKADLIFEVGGGLKKDPDVLLTKLVSGKETYVHRRFWSHFLTIATLKDAWQLTGLSDLANSMLNAVEKRGELRTNEFAHEFNMEVKMLGKEARLLERRLLVYGDDFHTSNGYHAKLLKSWDRWMLAVGFRPDHVNPVDTRKALEVLVGKINREFGAAGTLPWRAAGNLRL